VQLDPETVRELAIAFQPASYLRVLPHVHRSMPLGMGFGHTRFSSPTKSFRLVYLAQNLATGIAETIVRDRFEGVRSRVLDEMEFEDWAVTEVSALQPLVVLDLRTVGLLRLGVTTDAARAKRHDEGRTLSEALYRSFDIDGLLYTSRLTATPCVAIYDRAVSGKLKAGPVFELLRHPELILSLQSIGVAVRTDHTG